MWIIGCVRVYIIRGHRPRPDIIVFSNFTYDRAKNNPSKSSSRTTSSIDRFGGSITMSFAIAVYVVPPSEKLTCPAVHITADTMVVRMVPARKMSPKLSFIRMSPSL